METIKMKKFKDHNEKVQLAQIWSTIYSGTNLASAGLLADSFSKANAYKLDVETVREQVRQFEQELAAQENPQVAQKAFQLTVKNTLRYLDNQ